MISDRGKKDDILWFTLFHEIAHLIKHSKKEVFIDLENDEKNDIENEADEFARNILIPDDIYNKFINQNYLYTEPIIKKFSLENNITTGIVVGRLQKDGKIGWNEFSNLITRFKKHYKNAILMITRYNSIISLKTKLKNKILSLKFNTRKPIYL